MKQTLSRNRLSRSKVLVAAAVLGLAIAPAEALAHQVQTDYILDSQPSNSTGTGLIDSLQLRTTFTNGQPLKGAKVTVYAPDQPYRVRATGKTDSHGRFTFTPDQPINGNWEVNIEREGHQDILTVPVTEKGIDIDLVAQTGLQQSDQDIHYASSPWAAVVGVAIAAACLGFAKVSGKKSA
ncbi:MAG: carboxypeptidase regulatory-like domain-containing protein [Phormidesmis sp.]